jgi:PPOX class probable F420-dependent enzyme
VTVDGLGLASRIMALQYRLYDRLRHPRAFEVAGRPGIGGDFSGFRAARQCLLVTFRGSGEPVPTPVNFGLAQDGRLYFRSEPHVAKIRRLQRDPRVRVCPCSFRGKPRGELIEATARVLPPAESERARTIVASNWRLDTRVFERALDGIGVPEVFVEVTPVSAAQAGS